MGMAMTAATRRALSRPFTVSSICNVFSIYVRYPAKLAAMLTVSARTAVLKKKATAEWRVTSRRNARDLIEVSDVWEVAPIEVEKYRKSQ